MPTGTEDPPVPIAPPTRRFLTAQSSPTVESPRFPVPLAWLGLEPLTYQAGVACPVVPEGGGFGCLAEPGVHARQRKPFVAEYPPAGATRPTWK